MMGAEMRALRKAMKLTQAQLGDAIGMNRATVCDMERGRDKIELRTALAVRYVFEHHPLTAIQPQP